MNQEKDRIIRCCVLFLLLLALFAGCSALAQEADVPQEVLEYIQTTYQQPEIEDYLALPGLPEAKTGYLHLYPHEMRGEGHFVSLLQRSADAPTLPAQQSMKDKKTAKAAKAAAESSNSSTKEPMNRITTASAVSIPAIATSLLFLPMYTLLPSTATAA